MMECVVILEKWKFLFLCLFDDQLNNNSRYETESQEVDLKNMENENNNQELQEREKSFVCFLLQFCFRNFCPIIMENIERETFHHQQQPRKKLSRKSMVEMMKTKKNKNKTKFDKCVFCISGIALFLSKIAKMHAIINDLWDGVAPCSETYKKKHSFHFISFVRFIFIKWRIGHGRKKFFSSNFCQILSDQIFESLKKENTGDNSVNVDNQNFIWNKKSNQIKSC